MTKGGYQILDLSGNSFTRETTAYVKGAYENKVKENKAKSESNKS